MFGPTVSRMLEDARLDPKDLESLVLAAIEEDLAIQYQNATSRPK